MSCLSEGSFDDNFYFHQEDLQSRMDDAIFLPTRFAHWNTMTKLGIKRTVEEIFDNMGIRNVLRVRDNIYPEACKEFLSTVKFEAPTYNSHGLIVFDIRERTYVLTIREICEALYVHSEDYEVGPHVHGSANVWENIASGSSYASGAPKIAQVRNPAIRYCLQVLGSTLFARTQPDVPSDKELMLLYGATKESMKTVRDQPLILEWKRNPISLFIDYVCKLKYDHQNSDVVEHYIGGMITPLLKRARVDLRGLDYDDTKVFLDMDFLVNSCSLARPYGEPKIYPHLYLDDNDVAMCLPLPCPGSTHIRTFEGLSLYPTPSLAYRAPPPYDNADSLF